MTPRLLLRCSLGSLVLFLVGHGLGSMSTATRDATEASVFAAMRDYSFNIMGVTRSHWDFYQGMNHYLSAALVTLIAMHVVVIRLVDHAPGHARAMVWVLAGGLTLFALLSWAYFFPAPAVLSTVSALSLTWAASRLRTA